MSYSIYIVTTITDQEGIQKKQPETRKQANAQLITKEEKI
jgi:hypothetical protein